MTPTDAPANPALTPPGLHLPSLAVGLGLMVVLTVYPPLLTQPDGRADHTLATVLLWAMSAGLVRGVGFVPRWPLWRWLLSGYACFSALALACIAKAAPLF